MGRGPIKGRSKGLNSSSEGRGRLSATLLQKMLGMGQPKKGEDLNDIVQLAPEMAARGGPYAYYLRQGRRKLVVKIPPGVRDGQRIRLSGMGRPGKSGGSPGDLYLRVKINKSIGRRVKEFFGNLLGH